MAVMGEQEQLTLGGGYQKTFHDAKSDRDLFIGKIVYLPDEGWDANATLWVDLYVGKDDLNTSEALAQVHEAVRWVNSRPSWAPMEARAIRDLFGVFDRLLDILDEGDAPAGDDDAEIEALVQEREEAIRPTIR